MENKSRSYESGGFFPPDFSTGIVQKCITPHIHNLGPIFLLCTSKRNYLSHPLRQVRVKTGSAKF